eukprot:TRINITY_DN6276_c0_g1_i1.p1 TRINITY_DN6276_c0_g1~~TRINITY_DN6276_c0_g1_i1.p1  ORF type:complete len:373 (+),score=55.70 TRINITY_DN6276_c0_g1_i1:31-1149(+)
MDESDGEVAQPRDELNVEADQQPERQEEEAEESPRPVISSRDELDVVRRASGVTNTSIGSNEAKTTNSHIAQDHAREIAHFTKQLQLLDTTMPMERENPRKLRMRKRITVPTTSTALIPADRSPSHSSKEEILEIIEEIDQPIYSASSPRYGADGIFHNTVFTDRIQYSESSFQGLIHKTTHMPHGYGHKKYNNGCELVCGQWVNGIPNGVCLYTFANGDRYRGSWANGAKHGNGILLRHNDAIYRELYEEGTRISRVTVRKPSKDKMTTPEPSPTSASSLPAVSRKPEIPKFTKRQSAPAITSKGISPVGTLPVKPFSFSKPHTTEPTGAPDVARRKTAARNRSSARTAKAAMSSGKNVKTMTVAQLLESS